MDDNRSVQEFYDLRGIKALNKKHVCLGSDSTIPYLRTPYLFSEALAREKARRSSASHLQSLDLCCGTGLHALRLAELGYEVTGVDISEASIQAAKRFSSLYGLEDKTVFSVQDASRVADCSDAIYDFVLVSGSLYYLNQDTIYKEIFRILKPGGVFCAVETNGSALFVNLWRRLKNVFSKHRDQQTLTKLLRSRDVQQLQKKYPSLKVRYFDCFTLAGKIFKNVPMRESRWFKMAQTIDCFLLNKLKLRWLAFKFVMYTELP